MSENENSTPEPEAKKVYPGNIERYNEVRAKRLAVESHNPDSEAAIQLAFLEELVGLNYILDGIRYSLRKS